MHVKYLLELVLVEGVGFYQYLPSQLAAAAVYLALCVMKQLQQWVCS